MITITTPVSMLAPWEAGPADTPETQAAETQVAETPEAQAEASKATKDLEVVASVSPPWNLESYERRSDDLIKVVNSGVADCFAYRMPDGILVEEHKLLDPIYKVHRDILSLLDREKKLAAELNDIRVELNASRDAKAALLEALPAQLLKIREGVTSETMPAVDADQDPAQPSTTKPSAPEPPDNAWRAIKTETITTGVVGLGVKKAQTLIDEFPTLGDLEDARARAIASHKHFADQLPKGIGKQSADELANRVMAAQTRGDTRPASEVVEPRTSEETQSKLKHEQWVRATAASLRATADEDSLKSDVGESWVDGFDARSAGKKATDCPRELTEAHQTDWLKGWLHFDLFNQRDAVAALRASGVATEELPGEGGSVDETAQSLTDEDETEAEEAAAEHAAFVKATLDWLERFPDERLAEKAGNKEMWQVGADAYTEGVEAIECPTEVAHTSEELAITEAMQVDWLRGWESERSQNEGTNEIIPPAATTPLEAVSVSTVGKEPKAASAETAPTEVLPGLEQTEAFGLEQMAESIKADSDRKPRHNKDAWDAGYTAAIDEQEIETCPAGLDSQSRSDWVRGWVSGSEISFTDL